MKRIFWILALGAMVAACSPNDDRGGSLDDGKKRIVLDFEGEYWDSLIDNPQYNGELLYKQEGYSWHDEATDLYSIVNELWYTAAYWNGGKWCGLKPKTGIEENARQARYDLMYQACQKKKIKHLFLAHHIKDQAETFWIRLTHGSGVDGLGAMDEISFMRDIVLMRPLLGQNKEEILNYLKAKKINPFRKIIPAMGGIDFSPIIALLFLQF